ncbi:unnamed protein product [Paramecium octaurelia]|uniref:WD40-repeat-containing domain n=1 Tax=Paramecium octaurelia TaxID=43137 RepID=A0A8S1XCP9_PAROT|nr:unnamed protein product [Paramecium octaurelia]
MHEQISKVSKKIKKQKFTFTQTTTKKNVEDQKNVLQLQYVQLSKQSNYHILRTYNIKCSQKRNSILFNQKFYKESHKLSKQVKFYGKNENYDQFISGSFDGKIIIWSPNKLEQSQIQQKQWSAQFIWLGHASYANFQFYKMKNFLSLEIAIKLLKC